MRSRVRSMVRCLLQIRVSVAEIASETAPTMSLRWKEPQLELLTDSTGNNVFRYSEDCSKTNQGGLKHRKIKPKVVDAYENKKDRKRCLVTLFKKYTYHCPENKPNGFYLRPLAKPKGAIWYAAQPIGSSSYPGCLRNVQRRRPTWTSDKQLFCQIG